MKIQKLNDINIDDSPLHFKTLTKIVKRHPNLTLKGYCSNALRVRQMLKYLDIDLILLNVAILIINGFDFWKHWKKFPK